MSEKRKTTVNPTIPLICVISLTIWVDIVHTEGENAWKTHNNR